jgi:hypothetical protein
LQALIEKVMLHGVPAELLAGLLYLDQSTSGTTKSYQMISNPDVITLPEANHQQQARYIYQKFQGDIPGEMVPQLPVSPPELLPPGDQSGATPKPDEDEWTGLGQRRTSNVGNRKKED